ncbi:MAG: hypothetical protein R3E96_09800 [Planctomycetota bacterium]
MERALAIRAHPDWGQLHDQLGDLFRGLLQSAATDWASRSRWRS